MVNKIDAQSDLPLSAVTGIEPVIPQSVKGGNLPLNILNLETAKLTQEGGAVIEWKDMSPEERAEFNRKRLASATLNQLGTAKVEATAIDQRHVQRRENREK